MTSILDNTDREDSTVGQCSLGLECSKLWICDSIPLCCCLFTRIQPFSNPMDWVSQAPLSMALPRQEYWAGLPLPSPISKQDQSTENMNLCSPLPLLGACYPLGTAPLQLHAGWFCVRPDAYTIWGVLFKKKNKNMNS